MASAKPIGRSWYFAISASRSACGSLRRSRLPRTAVHAETQAIADLVAESSTEALKVLDIAAGHGLFGITIAQRNVRAEIVAVVLEFVPHADRVSPPVPARFSLTMLAGTPGGDAYTFAELRQQLEAAGLSNVSAHALPTPETIMLAEK